MISVKGIIGNNDGEVSLLSVIEQAQKETGDIHVEINSIGGDLDVGIAIYNYLVSLPNKVTTECSGDCASAASVVLLAGDERIIGCPVMIHNPWVESVSGDAEQLRSTADWLESAEKDLEKMYAERTRIDADTLSELMKTDTYLSPSQSVALGFGTQAKVIALARLNKPNINKNDREMSKTKRTLSSVVQNFLKSNPPQSTSSTKVYAMELTTSDGKTIQIDREEGEPQVGDGANVENGDYVMPDGMILTVEDGIITAIGGVNNEDDLSDVGDAVKTIEEQLEETLEALEDLSEDLIQARKLAKTPDEIRILNKIRMAGGEAKVFAKIASTSRPATRTQRQVNTNSFSDAVADRKQAHLEKYNKRKGA